MTKLDFPDTPSTGQLFGSSGTTWRWDGTRWGSTAGVAGEKGVLGLSKLTSGVGGIGATVTDIGLSVSTKLTAGRTYRVTLDTEMASTVAGDNIAGVIADGNGNQLQGHVTRVTAAALGHRHHVEHTFVSPLSGSYTFKGQVWRTAGTGTINVSAGAAYSSFIVVEDITYEAGSSGGPPVGSHIFGSQAGFIDTSFPTSPSTVLIINGLSAVPYQTNVYLNGYVSAGSGAVGLTNIQANIRPTAGPNLVSPSVVSGAPNHHGIVPLGYMWIVAPNALPNFTLDLGWVGATQAYVSCMIQWHIYRVS